MRPFPVSSALFRLAACGDCSHAVLCRNRSAAIIDRNWHGATPRRSPPQLRVPPCRQAAPAGANLHRRYASRIANDVINGLFRTEHAPAHLRMALRSLPAGFGRGGDRFQSPVQRTKLLPLHNAAKWMVMLFAWLRVVVPERVFLPKRPVHMVLVRELEHSPTQSGGAKII